MSLFDHQKMRLEQKKRLLSEVDNAITAILSGAQSYTIATVSLTRASLSDLIEYQKQLEDDIAAAETNSTLLSNTSVSYFDSGDKLGLIKNVRSAISQWNYERKYNLALADLEYELKRMYYDAASPDRLNSGWQSVVNLSGKKTDDSSRDFIRAKGRDLERNSDAMGGIISAFERNVVKDGITLQAKTDDEALNAQIEDLWKKWCKPRSSAADYVRLAQRMAGSGIGFAYESISRDMSQVNYSSARQGLIEDEGSYAIEQEALVSHVLDEVYSEFLISAVLCGKIQIKDFWDNKYKYLQHHWLMPGRKWIDPLKEASANKIAIQTGQLTLAQVVGAQGKDWREQIDEIAMIQEYAKQKGVDISGQQI